MKLQDIAENDISLRQYQRQSKIEIYDTWDRVPSVLFQMPTGTGKTRLFSSIIKDTQTIAHENKAKQPVLVLAHRTELIEQISDTLGQKYHIAHGIIKAGYPEESRYHVQVASVQSIARRLERWKEKKFSYIIIDEAHHVLARTYRKILEAFPFAKVLGVTATPYRLSGESFRDVFGALIVSQSVRKFIEQGYLSEYQYYSIPPNSYMQEVIDSIDEFGSDGDYKEEALLDACDKDYIRANLVNSYIRFAKGKKGIIYTICKEHNEHVCKTFTDAGFRVVTIDSETPASERKKLVDEFRWNEIDIICNVNIFSEGFDCPDIEFIQLARPTRSLSMYLQQVGRGLRPCKGKEGAIIIDNVGLYNRFGLPSANRQWRRHFEGKMDVQIVPEKKNPWKGIGRQRDLSEGHEELELVYSFGKTKEEQKNNVEESLAVLNSLASEVYFPMGILGEIRSLEYQRLYDAVNSRPDFSSSMKDEFHELLTTGNGFFPEQATPFKDVDEWEKNIQDVLGSADLDYETYERLEDVADQIVKFCYNGKYGVGVKRKDFIDKLRALRELPSSILSLDDVYDVQLDPVFDEIMLPDNNDLYVCRKNGKLGLIDGFKKTEILPFVYDEIQTIYRNLFIVSIDDKKGIVSKDSKLSPMCYESIFIIPVNVFNIGLICERYGLIDYFSVDKKIIYSTLQPSHKLSPCWFTSPCPDGGFFITDQSGHIAIPFIFERISIVAHERISFIGKIHNQYLLLSNQLEYIEILEDKEMTKYGKINVLKIIKEKQERPEKPILSDGFSYTNNSYTIVKGGEVIEKQEFQEIKKSGLCDFFIVKQDSKYGMIKYDEFEVKTIIPISYDKIRHLFGEKYLLSQSGNDLLAEIISDNCRYSLVKFCGKISEDDILIVTNLTGLETYVNTVKMSSTLFQDIEFLFAVFFKYKIDNQMWGIVSWIKGKGFQVVRNAQYDSISIRSAAAHQVLLSKDGERSRIITLRVPAMVN